MARIDGNSLGLRPQSIEWRLANVGLPVDQLEEVTRIVQAWLDEDLGAMLDEHYDRREGPGWDMYDSGREDGQAAGYDLCAEKVTDEIEPVIGRLEDIVSGWDCEDHADTLARLKVDLEKVAKALRKAYELI